MNTRRHFLQAIAAVTVFSTPGASAGPLDSLELDRRARILKQDTIAVPPASGGKPGALGADLVAPQRGYLGVDWALTEKRTVTVMLLRQSQKSQVLAGARFSGDPLLRLEIEGPETAGQNALVTAGTYYLVFLNRTATPVPLVYRTSFLPF